MFQLFKIIRNIKYYKINETNYDITMSSLINLIMKCLDNLIQYNTDHVKAVVGVSKTPGSCRGFKKPQAITGVSKNLRQ